MSQYLMEAYTLQRIELLKNRLDDLNKNKKDYCKRDYWINFHSLSYSIDQLYIILTAYSNGLENNLLRLKKVENKTKQKRIKRKANTRIYTQTAPIMPRFKKIW